MKLLIITQAVDTDHPILGFFVRWIEEFAKHSERITVICLHEGKHALPANVRVVSLGKERGVSRGTYLFNFYRALWRFRSEYDSVFVHMNPEYLLLGGLIWRIGKKRVALWYTHKTVDLKLRIGVWWATRVYTASKESFRLPTAKVRVMGHGIDTAFFSPLQTVSRDATVLSVGRLSPSKRHDMVIRAAQQFPNEVHILGDGPERERLARLTEDLSLTKQVHFLGAQTHTAVREEYRRAKVFVHTSETGSLDKVVLEALACGLPVITTNAAMADLPVTVVRATPEAIAVQVMALPATDPIALARYIDEHHSLSRLIPNILTELDS